MHVPCSEPLLLTESTNLAYKALQDTIEVAGFIGIPVYFVLLITVGPSQDGFSNVNSMLEQVASYQFVGMALRFFMCLMPCVQTYVVCCRDATHPVVSRANNSNKCCHVSVSFTMNSSAVYFGGFGDLFSNPGMEKSWLDHISGTICVFGFPLLIYFCVFSIIVRSSATFLTIAIHTEKRNDWCCQAGFRWSRNVQVASMVEIFITLRRGMNDEIVQHKELMARLKVRKVHSACHWSC